MRAENVVFYAGHSGNILPFAEAAKKLGYILMPFEGYTRVNADPDKRLKNMNCLQDIQRLARRDSGLSKLRIWDVADEGAIRADDAEWMARFGGKQEEE